MLILISPAKRMNIEDVIKTSKVTEPFFINEAETLVRKMRKRTPQEISKLMGISETLGKLNSQRFSDWSKSKNGAILPKNTLGSCPDYMVYSGRLTTYILID